MILETVCAVPGMAAGWSVEGRRRQWEGQWEGEQLTLRKRVPSQGGDLTSGDSLAPRAEEEPQRGAAP